MNLRKRLVVLAALVVALSTGALTVAGPASAHDAQPPCAWVSLGLYDGAGTLNGFQVWTSHSQLTVPSTACSDIYLTHVATCATGVQESWQARVRFYPASGGSYVNNWVGGYGGGWFNGDFHTLVIVASNVANGTKYKVEMATSTGNPPCMSLYH